LKHICIIKLEDSDAISDGELLVDLDCRVRRYLDRFYLSIPENDEPLRDILLQDFFEIIANEYESLIDCERNIENINILFHFIEEMSGPLEGSEVWDYGCGTGLSLEPAAKLGVKLTGIDRCEGMMKVGLERGMKVLSVEQLSNGYENSISKAFASYVFHFYPSERDLGILWKCFRPGGILVANFHKNRGVDEINEAMRKLRSSIIQLNGPANSERHGGYFAYIKRS
jgi:ubiquinone/menaquinone biosynthesis C-methylase UbiE